MAKAKVSNESVAVKAPEAQEPVIVETAPNSHPEDGGPSEIAFEVFPDPIQPPYISPKPTLGRIVIFMLSERAAAEINRRRTTPYSIGERIKLNCNSQTLWPIGAQAHIGPSVTAGDEFPAIVVKIFPANPSNGPINLQVFLDGSDIYWAQEVAEGNDEGQWHWPPRV